MKSVFAARAPVLAPVFALLALLSAAAGAALCDDTYNLQSATQTLFTGSDPKNLSGATKSLKGDLSDLTVLHPQMGYSILVGFEGSCTKTAKPVRFLNRDAGAAAFTPKTETAYQVVMYDSTTILTGSRFDYWFGFYKPADSLKVALGRIKGGGADFRGWYGYVAFEDSERNSESGLWTGKGVQLRIAGPADSATLDSILMVRTGYRDLVFNANRHGHFKLQFIRVSLENKPGIAIRRRAFAQSRARRDAAAEAQDCRADGKKISIEKGREFSAAQRYFSSRR